MYQTTSWGLESNTPKILGAPPCDNHFENHLQCKNCHFFCGFSWGNYSSWPIGPIGVLLDTFQCHSGGQFSSHHLIGYAVETMINHVKNLWNGKFPGSVLLHRSSQKQNRTMGASSTFLLSAPNLKPIFVWIWGKEKMHVAGRRLKGTTIWVLCVEESIHKEHFGFLLVPRTEGLQWPLATPRPLRWSKYPKISQIHCCIIIFPWNCHNKSFGLWDRRDVAKCAGSWGLNCTVSAVTHVWILSMDINITWSKYWWLTVDILIYSNGCLANLPFLMVLTHPPMAQVELPYY